MSASFPHPFKTVPSASFSEGLRVQWINRARYSLKNQDSIYFLEQIKHAPGLEKSIKNKAGAAEVRNTSSDQLTRDLTEQEKAALPEYVGELTMKTHGVGCYTSQAAMK